MKKQILHLSLALVVGVIATLVGAGRAEALQTLPLANPYMGPTGTWTTSLTKPAMPSFGVIFSPEG
jgi:hypothetical protein